MKMFEKFINIKRESSLNVPINFIYKINALVNMNASLSREQII